MTKPGLLYVARRLATLLLAVFGILAPLATGTARAEDRLDVFAAASLRDALEAVADDYLARTGTQVRLVFAASSVLARQIDAGAPADVYISANEEWVDWLAGRGAVDADRIRIVAGNRLVLALAEGRAPGADAKTILAEGRFAMGDPAHVPAGIYGKAALESLGLWPEVEAKGVFTENVRVALEMLRRGEVSAAIVYRSDLMLAPELVNGLEFPEHSHPPIRYAAAPVKNGASGAHAFLDYLVGPEGRRHLRAFGLASE